MGPEGARQEEAGQGRYKVGKISPLLPAAATIRADESDTVVLMIPQESFRRVLQQDEGFAVRVNILITSRRSAPTAVPA